MKRNCILFACIALAGTGLIGYGLFSPLVTVPVVGAVRFSENTLGGAQSVRCLMIMLGGASIFLGLGGHLARIGILAATITLGFLGGMLLSVHRDAMDKVMQIADMGDGKMDEGIAKLLAQMQYGAGAYCSVIGGVMILSAVAFFLWSERTRPAAP